MATTAEVKLVFEVNCPHCGSWNRFHDLVPTHENLKRLVQSKISRKPLSNDILVKCEQCNRKFDVDSIKLM